MRRMHFAGTLLSLACLTISSAWASEDPDSLALCDQVAPLMDADDFKALDAMADRFRKGQRNASGYSNLSRFYICISRRIGTAPQDVRQWNDWTAWAARWIRQSPGSLSAHLVAARVPLNLAWSFRGDGYAHEVSAQGWQQFSEYNAVAAAYMQEHKAIAKRDPYWYEMSLLIALRQGVDEAAFMALVDEGSRRFPDHDPLYLIAMQRFTPHWQGDAQQMEAFARHALARTSKRRRASLYARLYASVSEGVPGQQLFQNSAVDWPLMRQGWEDILAEYPTAWNLETAARHACLSSDVPAAKAWQRRLLAGQGIGEPYLSMVVDSAERQCLPEGSFAR
ncbi:hypothetical protein B0X78_07280 [bacterium AM6]|uniref:hypothetical protein n=1 Tax=unclassified Stenotrophomonas TaxID=196198 RepID=UPI000B62E5B0|nr:hypothetical protein [Stenotrophomonas sp. DR822]OUL14733.1 hypothetical protein B0X78_07280 [bacterium AM6]QZN81207.1 hypothetical protein K5K93_01880 [Stenotrophomonas sp. DR822]